MEKWSIRDAFKALDDVIDEPIEINETHINRPLNEDFEPQHAGDEFYQVYTIDFSGFEYINPFEANEKDKALDFAKKAWDKGEGGYEKVVVLKTKVYDWKGDEEAEEIWNSETASDEPVDDPNKQAISDEARQELQHAKNHISTQEYELRHNKEKQNEEVETPINEDEANKLEPVYDSRKSFYGKARVVTKDDGTKILYSYGTPVVRIQDGKATLLHRGYLGWSSSQTTLRHVKDFLQQNGFEIGSYKELAKMYPQEQAKINEQKETIKENIEKQKQAAFENACDCLKYGSGRDKWNSCGLNKEDADAIWTKATDEMSKDECLHEDKGNKANIHAFDIDYEVTAEDVQDMVKEDSDEEYERAIQETKAKLPKELDFKLELDDDLTKDEIDDLVCDYITEKTGWLIRHFDYDIINNESLNEGKTIDLRDETEVDEGEKFMKEGEKEADIEQIVDVDAEDISDLKKTYIGSIILECPICHTKIYKAPEDLVKSDKQDKNENFLYNVDEECPHCGATEEGFIVVGQVAKLDVDPNKEPEAPVVEKEPEPEKEPEKEPEVSPIDTMPSLEGGEPKQEESLNEDADEKTARYFIKDTIAGDDDPEYSEFKTEKDFWNSLEYNRDVAEEYGDEPAPIEDVRKAFSENEDHDETFNGFVYIKLTNKSLAEWEGISEEELGDVEVITSEEDNPVDVATGGDEPEQEETPNEEDQKEDLNPNDQNNDQANTLKEETGDEHIEFEVGKYDEDHNVIDEETQFFADKDEAIEFAKENDYDYVTAHTYVEPIEEPKSSETIWEKGEEDLGQDTKIISMGGEPEDEDDDSEDQDEDEDSEEYKFVIKYSDSTEEDYEDVTGYDEAEKWFNELKAKGGIDYIEVYHVVGDSWEDRDPEYIVLEWEAPDDEDEGEDTKIVSINGQPVEEFDEHKFDNLTNQFLKENYKAIESYTTTKAKIDNQGKIVLEGVIKYTNGKEKPTRFIIESKIKDGKVRIKAINESLVRVRKPLNILGKMDNNSIVCEKLSYRTKTGNNVLRVK